MKRKREMVVLCHCILNSNAKVEGIATYGGAIENISTYIIKKGIGILQLPCPETTMYGIKRWGQVKDQFDTPYFRKHCRKILSPYLDQIQDYLKNGYKILGVVGLEGSPSCGINKTCVGQWGGEFVNEEETLKKMNTLAYTSDSGIFIEEMKKVLEERNIHIPFIGIEEMDPDASFEKFKTILEGKEDER